ncbi:AAA family ATPase [Thiohalorhabdus sp. Cl-TMA]|uniref:Flagellar biosynthesis protein FlhF n=1 Tax=Thiohalorhabdus methylotrophus TaxID=3242694 RepID=A0ABV4TWI3_9GAMM
MAGETKRKGGTYEGRTLREAMRRAQEELGPTARMQDTSRLPDGGWQVRASVSGSGALPSSEQSTGEFSDGEEVFLRELRSEVAELRRLVATMETGPLAEGEALLRKRGLSPGAARALWRLEAKGRPTERAIKLSHALKPEQAPIHAALVGPTGSGKTTTIAKLAAKYLLQGMSVYLVGTDAFRIGAMDQLQQYARIMEVPLSIARDAHELRQVLQRTEGYDVVLVDTIGRGARARREVNELAAMFKGFPDLRRHLVLPGNVDLEDARIGWQTFRCLKPSSLLTTKMDETGRPARALEIAVASGLPLAAFGCGQQVPEDFGFYSYKFIRTKLLGFDQPDGGER